MLNYCSQPKMCTTLQKEGNVSGADNCQGWTSCEEWCLSKSDLNCHHVYAAVVSFLNLQVS